MLNGSLWFFFPSTGCIWRVRFPSQQVARRVAVCRTVGRRLGSGRPTVLFPFPLSSSLLFSFCFFLFPAPNSGSYLSRTAAHDCPPLLPHEEKSYSRELVKTCYFSSLTDVLTMLSKCSA